MQYFYYWYFISSWNQIGFVYCDWLSILVTFLYIYIYGICCKLSQHVLQNLSSASYDTYLPGFYI